MLIDFIATFAAGFAAAGAVLALNLILGRRLPRWLTPVAAGAAMLAYAIWSEYSWFDRTVEPLPESVEVITKVETSAVWRPWTYVVPMTSRFMAFDRAGISTNDAAPGQKLVDLLLFARWSPTVIVPVLYDCNGARRADLIDGAEMAADGTVSNADWVDLPADDRVMNAVCAEG